MEQGECPKCGEFNLEFGSLELEDNSVFYPVTCKCGFEGKEYYNLEFDCYYDNNGNKME